MLFVTQNDVSIDYSLPAAFDQDENQMSWFFMFFGFLVPLVASCVCVCVCLYCDYAPVASACATSLFVTHSPVRSPFLWLTDWMCVQKLFGKKWNANRSLPNWPVGRTFLVNSVATNRDTNSGCQTCVSSRRKRALVDCFGLETQRVLLHNSTPQVALCLKTESFCLQQFVCLQKGCFCT